MWISVYKFEDQLNVHAQRLTSSMPMHPLPVLLNNGVPVALSCDDPSAFGNMGLTFDFFQVRIICGKKACLTGAMQVLVASEMSGLGTLGTLARDSIEVGFLFESLDEVY